MPELPEVETIRRQLAPRVQGRVLARVQVDDERWCMPLAPAAMERALRGRRVESLGRRGKYLVWRLSGERHLLQHLRMTGNLLYDPGDRPVHTRVAIDLDDGHQLLYVDARRFGTGQLAEGRAGLEDFLGARLGLEPFDPGFGAEHLQALARGSRAPVKAFLLDQKRIAGVGNIYADEALFRARIHPQRPVGTLKRPQLEALRAAVVESLNAGIDARGASIDDFRHPDGAKGSFQDRFLIHLREGEPCVRCGRTVKKMRAAGRGTYVCERCQPRPRTSRRASATP
jgi:formamidopyrimidine-DNA glycosylase